ncbi:MAG: glutamine-synthetase adenylyltransferase, partial [Gemmatimonadaceae bacterium]|nr:glutamine-synthetase adenylyltransferase [Acetobacteraceae bacterium]
TVAAVGDAIATPADPLRIRADAAAMRGRLLRDLPASGPWDVKLRPGGGIEVEFIAQVLQLIHGVRPGQQATRVALQALADDGQLLPATAAMLIHADRLWRTVQSMARITVGRGTPTLPDTAAEALVRVVTPGLDLARLRATLDATAVQVRGAFTTLVGNPE